MWLFCVCYVLECVHVLPACSPVKGFLFRHCYQIVYDIGSFFFPVENIFANRYQFWLYFNSITFTIFISACTLYTVSLNLRSLRTPSIRDRYCRLHNYGMIARHNSSDGLIFHMNWWAENTIKRNVQLSLFCSIFEFNPSHSFSLSTHFLSLSLSSSGSHL